MRTPAHGENTWAAFPHDQAGYRAYRWGEDGLAGISDDKQLLCLALALWNERDPILKERLFGLTNAEGNHGEDVKECYYYLDATPTSSYLKMLYKYPQRAFPYDGPRRDQRGAGQDGAGIRAARHRDLRRQPLLRRRRRVREGRARGRPHAGHGAQPGPRDAELHVLPTLWFRHTWSWAGGSERARAAHVDSGRHGPASCGPSTRDLGARWFYADGGRRCW